MTTPNLPALLRLQAEIARENAAALDEMADLLEAGAMAGAMADVLEARAQEQEPENETRPH